MSADIAKLRELLAEAPPAPWTITQGTPSMSGSKWTIRRKGAPGIQASGYTYGHGCHMENLIVAAVNALSELLDELERLRTEKAAASRKEDA